MFLERRTRRRLWPAATPVLILAGLCCGGAGPVTAQSFGTTDAPLLSSGVNNRAFGINLSNSTTPGMVVGWSEIADGGDKHAFVFSSGDNSTDLGVLTGGSNSQARAINASGQIVGWSELTGGATHAVLWSDPNDDGDYSDATKTDLGVLTGGTDSEATAINDDGIIVGWSEVTGGAKHACLWRDPNGDGDYSDVERIDLGVLTGGTNSEAYGINSLGDVVGTSEVTGGEKRAFLWIDEDGIGNGEAGVMNNLGVFTGGTNSEAFGLNDLGEVVGTSEVTGGAKHAFLYLLDIDVMIDLGTLGGTNSEAYGINSFGQIVGYSEVTGGAKHAFLFSGWAMYDLNDLSGETLLTEARGINDAQQIAGVALSAETGGDDLAIRLSPAVDIASIALAVETVVGGKKTTGTVTLAGAAPAGGLPVLLSSSDAAVTVPVSVTVPEGKTFAKFSVTTAVVANDLSVTLAAGCGLTKTVTLAVTGITPVLTKLAVSPKSVVGGSAAIGTVTLSGPAPTGGTEVTLADGGAAATTPPATVTVAEGESTATFSLTTAGVSSDAKVTITGTLSGVVKQATLLVKTHGLSSLKLSRSSVTGGDTLTGVVLLATRAPEGGVTVTLSDAEASATTCPATVSVPEGAMGAGFTITTAAVAANTTVTLSSSLGKLKKTAKLVVKAPALTEMTLSAASVTSGGTVTGTLTLSSAAPTGGLTVTLTSTKTAAATVPATASVAAGATTATFTVTAQTVSAATPVSIKAKLATVTKTAALTVNQVAPVTLESVALDPTSVTGGTSATGTVTLSGNAPTGGTTVTLASSDPAATVGASVTVEAGESTATFTVNTTAVAANTAVTITATLTGANETATLTVNAPALTALSLDPTSVVGGTNSTGTVTLSGPAPAGGMVVNLASGDGNATVNASVTVPAGATSAPFTVTTGTVTVNTIATITASLNGTDQTADLTITPS